VYLLLPGVTLRALAVGAAVTGYRERVSPHGRLLMLADDFTGACDAAGAFGASRTTRMVVGATEDWPPDVEVLAVDLDVRERSASEATTAVEAAARLIASATHLFVKIDSTLRGPIAALVESALRVSKAGVAVVAPAFPEQGRLLRGGRLIVNGELGPSLVELLGKQGTTVVTAPSSDGLEIAIAQARRDRRRTVIVDAETAQSLRGIAAAARRHPEWLLVGSAGLARQLADSPGRSLSLPPHGSGPGPLLVVAGSHAQATRAQLSHLESLDNVVVLASAITDTRDTGAVTAELAELVAAWAERHTPHAVVLTGGATASAVCKRIGARALDVHGELAPGIPIATFHQGIWHGLTVVTKAGGFGSPETLLDVARALGVSS